MLAIMHLCRHGLPENDGPDIDGHGLSERMNKAATLLYYFGCIYAHKSATLWLDSCKYFCYR